MVFLLDLERSAMEMLLLVCSMWVAAKVDGDRTAILRGGFPSVVVARVFTVVIDKAGGVGTVTRQQAREYCPNIHEPAGQVKGNRTVGGTTNQFLVIDYLSTYTAVKRGFCETYAALVCSLGRGVTLRYGLMALN